MTTGNEMTARSLPWYRYAAPWLLMLGPFVVVVAGFITLGLAIRSNDGLVAEDYYKQGLAINQTIAQAQRADALQVRARLQIGGDRLHVSLSQREGTSMPPRLRLSFSNEARSGVDQSVELEGIGSEFHGAMPTLPSGLWLVLLEDGDRTWRRSKPVRIPHDGEIDFGPVQ